MKTIKVQFNGKGYKVNYTMETIDLPMTPLPFLNVYAVYVDDPDLQKIVGEHFTILQHPTATVMPVYNVKSSSDINETNLKKTIAQQIMNDPTA